MQGRAAKGALAAAALLGLAAGCGAACACEPIRNDGAYPVTVPTTGSHQNPAFSPDGSSLLLTRFRGGYNVEPADLVVQDLAGGSLRTLVSDGNGNVNLPGSAWNAASGRIVFSSSRDPHDEIYAIDGNGSPGDEARVTSRATLVAYEPSLSPDGAWVVFESHVLDVEGDGVVTRYRMEGSGPYEALTGVAEDCRQPNWSPAGDLIVYQRIENGQWDLWVMGPDGGGKRRLTSGPGDETDASFSPDGRWIVFSSDEGGLPFANLFVLSRDGGASRRITFYDGYDGAPSWSPDGARIAFESHPGDPDGSGGTRLWMIPVPEDLA